MSSACKCANSKLFPHRKSKCGFRKKSVQIATGVFAGAAVIAATAGIAHHCQTKNKRKPKPRYPVDGPVPEVPKIKDELDSGDTDDDDDDDDDYSGESSDENDSAGQAEREREAAREKELEELRKIARQFRLWINFQMNFTPWILVVVQKVEVEVRGMHNGTRILQDANLRSALDTMDARDVRFCGIRMLSYKTVAKTAELWRQLVADCERDFAVVHHFSRTVRSSLVGQGSMTPQVDSLLTVFDATIPELKIRRVELLFPPQPQGASSGSR